MRYNRETKEIKGSVVLPNGQKYNVGTVKVIVSDYGFYLTIGTMSSLVRKMMKANGINTSEYTVRSSSFSGGDSIDVSENDKTTSEYPRKAIEDLLNSVQRGSFNGMIDMYENASVTPVLYSHDGTVAINFGFKFAFFNRK